MSRSTNTRKINKIRANFKKELDKLTHLEEFTSWEAGLIIERIIPDDDPLTMETISYKLLGLLKELDTVQGKVNTFTSSLWTVWENRTGGKKDVPY